ERGRGGRGRDPIGCRRARSRRRWRRPLLVAIGADRDRHQLVRQPAAIFFSAAYLAAASLTIGAITLSSLTYQSDVFFQSLPSQAWMRPVRAPSWSAQDTLTGLSTPSKPSSLMRSALMSRFSHLQ